MQTADRISKKQLEVMRQWLDDARAYIKEADLTEIKDRMFEHYSPMDECREFYLERIDFHKKLYLSGRKDRKEAA